jgi:hypothetical protein
MTDKTDFEKIGVNTIRPFKKNGRWVFERDGRTYDMAPAEITDAVLDPLVVGADRLIALGSQAKGIKNPENGFVLMFSETFFPNADVLFTLAKPLFDGWVYDVSELNLKGLLPGQAAWVCPYITMYFPEPPKTLYLKIEADPGIEALFDPETQWNHPDGSGL